MPGPTLQPWPFGPLALGPAFHLRPHLSNLSSEQAQSGINSHVTGNPRCFDTSGHDKKVYYTAVISITAEQLGLQEAQNGGRQAEEICEGGGGDRLWNSNSEQHVWLTCISPLGSGLCAWQKTEHKDTHAPKQADRGVYVHYLHILSQRYTNTYVQYVTILPVLASQRWESEG